MTFLAYDPSTDIGKVRLYLGDSIEGAGPRPNADHTNYSDEEITLFLEAGSVNSGLISGFRALAGEWAAFAISEGSSIERMDAKNSPDTYLKMAEYYENHPIDVIGQNSLIIQLDRDDAYTVE